MTAVLIAIAVAVLLLWPQPQRKRLDAPVSLLEQTREPKYLDAVRALQVVRLRLASTQRLDADAEGAIEKLTLQLIAGNET